MIQSKYLFYICLFSAITVPAAAQTAGGPQPAAASVPASASKKCTAATRKVDREQKALNTAVDSIAKDRKGRESCSTKNMCSRYDSAIDTMEKRKARHETRLARFKDDAQKACNAT
jgi:hypothetical protein